MRIEIESLHLDGVVVLRPEVYEDRRGFFMEAFRADRFAELGLPTRFVQDNHSRSTRGVRRLIYAGSCSIYGYTVNELYDEGAPAVSSYPRLDLIVNTMFACAMRDGKITVNNPAIWRSILSIHDAASAYIRALDRFQDFDNPVYSNIAVFRRLYESEELAAPSLTGHVA